MKKVVLVNKKIGETPLDSIGKLKSKFPEYKNSKIAYAGRLDPMAQGLLVLLVDDECKKRYEYQSLNKTYKFEFILGVGTDTSDLLGLVNGQGKSSFRLDEVIAQAKGYLGKYNQQYPIYSSYTVHGKPLFWWARENKLDQIEIPSKEVEIKALEFISDQKISKSNLEKEIVKRVGLVSGDFRQEEIVSGWKDFFQNTREDSFQIYKFSSDVGSGTYIRQLVSDIGTRLGSFATTFSIERTKVGNFSIEESLQL